MTFLRATLLIGVLSVIGSAQSLDYDVFKNNVQPIFLKKRPTHARCVVCHAGANNQFRLERLDKGATTWTEEQTRKNFETVLELVTPGDPDNSHLLKQPLAATGGGEQFHSGGRQFATKDDPDWKTMAAWVKAAKK